MSMQSPAGEGHRILLLAASGLAIAAAMVAATVVATPDGAHRLAAAALVCGTLLLGAAAAVWHAGRRLANALRAAEGRAARSRSELQAALDNMSQGLVLCDTSANVVAVNNRFLQLFNIQPQRVRPGMSVADLIRLQAEAGAMTAEHAEILVGERLNRPPGASGRMVMPFPRGQLEVAYQPRPEGGWACTFEDVTAQKDAERRLAFLAQHDSLTGLPNRALLRERIGLAIKARTIFAVMLIDLDHFKLANDTFGHATGDALLCAVSDRLCAEMRDSDIVARLGGDEFAVLMGEPCTREEADRLAARLIRTLTEPFVIAERRLRIGCSIGISLATKAADPEAAAADTDLLLHQADLALYRAKQEGRRGHRFFEPLMERAPFVDCQ